MTALETETVAEKVSDSEAETATDSGAAAPSVLITDATVHRVTRTSPAFVRVELASPAFVDLAEVGFDTRIKIVLPGPTGTLPAIPPVAEDYYLVWSGAPDEVRSPMRTYTIRDIVRDGRRVRLVVDFVVHDDDGHGQGPACRWALSARPGDVIQVVGPRSADYGGTEFDPAGRSHVVLIGDETAVPAISRILADVRPGLTGEVFVEVPSAADIVDLPHREGFEVRWFARESACGRRLVQEVRRHLGLPPSTDFEALPELPSNLDIDVWETPRYSASGEDLEAQPGTRSVGHDLEDTYAWIAGESWMVKAMRRSLVSELGLERAQVAFMGYWREGVAMRS